MNKKIIISGLFVLAGLIGLLVWVSDKKIVDSETNAAVGSDLKEKINFKEAVGQKAPDFELESIAGNTVKLSNYLGKKNIVLFFNEGAMCYPACWNQIAELGKDSRFDTENLVAFSVVTDSRNRWLDIVDKSPDMAKSKILFDITRAVSRAYNVLSLDSSMHVGTIPGHTYFIIDKEGIIRFTLDDPNMAIANDSLIKEIDKLK